jgi:hypothetical protein
MGSRISDTRLPASARSEAPRNAGARIPQHLNNAVVAQRVVQQLEEDGPLFVRAAYAPSVGQAGRAYSVGRPRTRRASAAARRLRAPQRSFCAANTLGSGERIHP